MKTSLELHFADGEYSFALKLPQLAELQRSRACGIFALYGRVLQGSGEIGGQMHAIPQMGAAFFEDVLETIRLGLIGGGYGMVNGEKVEVNAVRAKQLVEAYCYPAAPLREAWDVARSILFACVEGYEPPKPEPVVPPVPEEQAAEPLTDSI